MTRRLDSIDPELEARKLITGTETPVEFPEGVFSQYVFLKGTRQVSVDRWVDSDRDVKQRIDPVVESVESWLIHLNELAGSIRTPAEIIKIGEAVTDMVDSDEPLDAFFLGEQDDA